MVIEREKFHDRHVTSMFIQLMKSPVASFIDIVYMKNQDMHK